MKSCKCESRSGPILVLCPRYTKGRVTNVHINLTCEIKCHLKTTLGIWQVVSKCFLGYTALSFSCYEHLNFKNYYPNVTLLI